MLRMRSNVLTVACETFYDLPSACLRKPPLLMSLPTLWLLDVPWVKVILASTMLRVGLPLPETL